jgi:CheY-like chemotaxis protein
MENKRILIADDEKVLRMLMAEALKSYDYEIDVVKNGIEAISYIEKRSYDLIITDYMMPEMDGLELTRRIKAKYPSIPILVITGNGPVQDLLKSGATACIMKPFNIFELQNTVKNILKKERSENI